MNEVIKLVSVQVHPIATNCQSHVVLLSTTEFSMMPITIPTDKYVITVDMVHGMVL